MKVQLDDIGKDLAIAVKSQSLPTTSLDVDIFVTDKGLTLLDTILETLPKVMNSMFFVGDDLDFLNSYVNALAIVMNNQEEFSELVRRHSEKLVKIYPWSYTEGPTSEERIENRVQRLIGKRLHTLNMHTLLSLLDFDDKQAWDEFMKHLIQKTQKEGYYLVIQEIHELYKKENRDKLHYQALDLMGATKGNVQLAFIAPLTWDDYVLHIEHGMFPGLIRHRTPILFSPRPSHLPLPQIAQLTPDKRFHFTN